MKEGLLMGLLLSVLVFHVTFFSWQVEDAFENNDLDLVSEKLAGMQASLRLLHHVVDYQVPRDLDLVSE